MAAALRGLVIGGLIITHSICTASTVSPPGLSTRLRVLPQISFLNKGTVIPIRVHIMHSPVLDVSNHEIIITVVASDQTCKFIQNVIFVFPASQSS